MRYECENCGAVWHFDKDRDVVIAEPSPHYECPDCGFHIPALG